MSGRGRRATVCAIGTIAAVLSVSSALGGCSSSHHASSSASPPPGASAAPPVGSVDHPRPVSCSDGATVTPSATPTGTPARPSGTSTRSPGRHTSPAPSTSASEQPRKDVTVGPLTLRGLRGLADGNQYTHGVHNSEGWHYLIGAAVGAGADVTVTIGAEQRARAGLEFGGAQGMTPAPAVTFHGCPDGATSFLGAFFLAGDGRACVPLDIRVGDGATQRVVISFYNGRCPA